MRDVKMLRIVPAVLVAVAFALSCAEQPSAPDLPIEAAAAPGAGCELISGIAKATRDYFSQPTQNTASGMVRELGDACSDGNVVLTNSIAWDILRLVETTLGGSSAGAVSDGSTLVNGLLACTVGLPAMCTPAGLPGPGGSVVNFEANLRATGAFGVRGGKPNDLNYVVSRAPVPFLDWQAPPQQNGARWGMEVVDGEKANDWEAATGNPTSLVVGKSIGQGLAPVLDQQLSPNLQYNFDTYPDNARPFRGLVKVGACLTEEMPVPHEGDDQSPTSQGGHKVALLQRERVGLQKTVELSFCEQLQPQSASLAGSFVGLIADALPARLTSLFFGDRKAIVIGGLPEDNSRYALIGADRDGRIEVIQGPPSVAVANTDFDLKVQAFTGGGTPAERVRIDVVVFNNSGTPAGAVVGYHDPGAVPTFPVYTREQYDGALPPGVLPWGIATFKTQVGKPGGYILCVNGSYGDETTPVEELIVFAQVCLPQFQVRNN